MNENFDENSSVETPEEETSFEANEEHAKSAMADAEVKNAEECSSEKSGCFFGKHGKLIGACVAGVVAILLIIASIFVIVAASNLSRMARQQIEMNNQTQSYLDSITSLFGTGNSNNSYFGNGGGYNYGYDDVDDNDDFDLDDILDLFSQDSSSNNSDNVTDGGNDFNWEDLIDIYSSERSKEKAPDNSKNSDINLNDIISLFDTFITQN